MTNMRLILCASSTSKIIAPIRSRCLLVRVAAPDDDEVGFASHCVCFGAAADMCLRCSGFFST